MIFYMVIYVTLINLAEMECILLLLLPKEQSISLCICFRILTLGIFKIIFCRNENFKELFYCKCKCL